MMTKINNILFYRYDFSPNNLVTFIKWFMAFFITCLLMLNVDNQLLDNYILMNDPANNPGDVNNYNYGTDNSNFNSGPDNNGENKNTYYNTEIERDNRKKTRK